MTDKSILDEEINFSDFDLTEENVFNFDVEDRLKINSELNLISNYDEAQAISLEIRSLFENALKKETFDAGFSQFIPDAIGYLANGFAFGGFAQDASFADNRHYLTKIFEQQDNDLFSSLSDDFSIQNDFLQSDKIQNYPNDLDKFILVFRGILADWSILNPSNVELASLAPEHKKFIPFPVTGYLSASEGFKRESAPITHRRSILEGQERQESISRLRNEITKSISFAFVKADMANASKERSDKGYRIVLSGPSGVGKTQAFLEHLVANPDSYVEHTRLCGRPGEEREINAPIVVMMRTHAEMDRAIATMKALRLDPDSSDADLIADLQSCGWLSPDHHDVQGALLEAREMQRRCRHLRKQFYYESPPSGPLPELVTHKWMSRTRGGCKIPETVDALSKAGLSAARMCHTKTEEGQDIFCEHYGKCPWIGLQNDIENTQIAFLSTAYLKSGTLPESLKYPYLLVIDGDAIDSRIEVEVLEEDSLSPRFEADKFSQLEDHKIKEYELDDKARLWVLENVLNFAKRAKSGLLPEDGKRSLRDPAWGFALAMNLLKQKEAFLVRKLPSEMWNPFENGMLSPLPEGIDAIENALDAAQNYLARETRPEKTIEPNIGLEDALFIARNSETPQVVRERALLKIVYERIVQLEIDAEEAVRALLVGKEQPLYDRSSSLACGEWDHRIQWVEKRPIERGGNVKKIVNGVRFSNRIADKWTNETILLIGNFHLSKRRNYKIIKPISPSLKPKTLAEAVARKRFLAQKNSRYIRNPLVLAKAEDPISHEDILSILWGGSLEVFDVSKNIDMGRLYRVQTVLFPEIEYRRSEMEGYSHSLFSRQMRSCGIINRISGALSVIASAHGYGRIFAAGRKSAMAAMNFAWPLPINMDAAYFGNLHNVDLRARPSTAVLIGAFEVHPDTIDGIVSALTFDSDYPERPFDVFGNGLNEEGDFLYPPSHPDYYRLRDDGGYAICLSRGFNGRFANFINMSLRTAEASRVLGALSPIYRDNDAFLYGFGRVLPNDLIVDETLSVEEILPTDNMPDWNPRYHWQISSDQLPAYETYWARSAELPNTTTKRFLEYNPSGFASNAQPYDQNSLIETLNCEANQKKVAATILENAVCEQGGVLFPYASSVSPSLQLSASYREETILLDVLKSYGFNAPFVDEFGYMTLQEIDTQSPIQTTNEHGWVAGLFYSDIAAKPHPFWVMVSEFGEPNYLDKAGFAQIALKIQTAYYFSYGSYPRGGGIVLHVGERDAWIAFDNIDDDIVADILSRPSMAISQQREAALQWRSKIEAGIDELSHIIVQYRDAQIETPLIRHHAYINDFDQIEEIVDFNNDNLLHETKRHLVPIRQRGLEAFGRGLWFASQIKASLNKARIDAGLPHYESSHNSDYDKKRLNRDVMAMSHSQIPYKVLLTWFALQEVRNDGYGLKISDIVKAAQRRSNSLPKTLVKSAFRQLRQKLKENDLPAVFGIFPHASSLLSDEEICMFLEFEDSIKVGDMIEN